MSSANFIGHKHLGAVRRAAKIPVSLRKLEGCPRPVHAPCSDQACDESSGLIAKIDAGSHWGPSKPMSPADIEYTPLRRRAAEMRGAIVRRRLLVGADSRSPVTPAIPPGSISLALAIETDTTACVATIFAEPGAATRRYFERITVTIGNQNWRCFLEAGGFDTRLSGDEICMLMAPAVDSRTLQVLAQNLRGVSESAPTDLAVTGQLSALADSLLHAGSRAVSGSLHVRAAQPSWRAAARHRAAARACNFIEGHLNQPLPLERICRAACASARALEYGFQDLFGVSPIAYARCVRLAGVRRELYAVSETQLSVTDVAMRWGFWHLGQFSKDYRTLFGESPSETLALARTRPSGALAGVNRAYGGIPDSSLRASFC